MSFLQKLFGSKPTITTMSIDEFARRYADEVERVVSGAQVTIHPGDDSSGPHLKWTNPNGLEMTQFVGNAYNQYASRPDKLKEILAQHMESVTAAAGIPEDPQARRASILPVIKTTGWFATQKQQTLAAGIAPEDIEKSQPIAEPLVDDLIVTYVEDTPTSMRFLPSSAQAELGLEGAALRECALHNLEKMLPRLKVFGKKGRNRAQVDTNYDASMILLFDRWRDRLELTGDPVIAIAARDELLICGSADRSAMKKLKDAVTDIARRSPYALAAQLFTWGEDGLQVWDERRQ